MNQKLLLALGILAVILVSGCAGEVSHDEPQMARNSIIQACMAECGEELTAGTDLSNGPCLSNQISQDWVCDVAHDPREEIDNLAENQCEAYRNETAHHFVEVTPECELIRAV